jgi:hypothetical protein
MKASAVLAIAALAILMVSTVMAVATEKVELPPDRRSRCP